MAKLKDEISSVVADSQKEREPVQRRRKNIVTVKDERRCVVRGQPEEQSRGTGPRPRDDGGSRN